MLGPEPAWAQELSGSLQREPTFEELANITVTTASHHEERLFTVPAATSILTGEQIRDSGARRLPEALREVPGLNVAQINADTWAVGCRGFQSQFSSQLLVMIDGRSIYSPVWGGVPWEDNPVFLEDIKQVEVVRGPGSSIWGANAVNGVINILSHTAFETQGAYLFGEAGSGRALSAGVRQGVLATPHLAVRVYAQHQEQGSNLLPDGSDALDACRLDFGGTRIDWQPNPSDTLTFEAGIHDRKTDFVRTFSSLTAPGYTELSTRPIRARGQNISGKWRHDWEEGASLTVSTYWDQLNRNRPQFLESVTTWDFDAVYSDRPRDRNQVSAGFGYRLVDSNLRDGYFGASPDKLRRGLFSTFIYDELTLLPRTLTLSLGTKVEHHQQTGWNLQPSLRLSWLIREDLTAWSSVGQAVRIPYVQELTSDSDVKVYPPGTVSPTLPAIIRIYGNQNLKPEKLTAYEAGLRWRSPCGVTIDLAGFVNEYDDYILATSGGAKLQTEPPALVVGYLAANGILGESYGGELALKWDPQPWWRLGASCNYVQINLRPFMADPLAYKKDELRTPKTSLQLSSDVRLGPAWRLHCATRYVDPVPAYNIPAYMELDAKLAWQASTHLEIALVGRNLLDAQHPEYDFSLLSRLTELRRSINVVCQWSY